MKADINVTPLIDVLLVLLIIFMLVTPSAPTALPASLPRTADGDADLRPSQGVLLEVGREDWLLDARPVLGTRDLAARLRATLETRADRTLFVRVADGVPYFRVIETLDLARECGASRIGMMDPQELQRSLAQDR